MNLNLLANEPITFDSVLKVISENVWGWPLIIFILITGIYLTARLLFVQVRKLPLAFKYMFQNEKEGDGQMSTFASLCTALSATIGTGNIVGVATAICLGGPGALFWMLVAAFFGMATKYAECMLAVKYRQVDEDGHVLGGPFTYIEKGMKERFGVNFKWLAVIFAVLGICVGLFGIGTFTQINSITSAVDYMVPNAPTIPAEVPLIGGMSIAVIISGVILTVLVGLVILGGAKRISSVATFVVPFMAIIYVVVCIIILITNITGIPAAVAEIVTSAFSLKAVGGGITGTMIENAMRMGTARGIFSNESGLGSAPIASAHAQTKEPVRQGLVSMLGTFIDTIIVCTMTGLTIVIMGTWKPELGLVGVDVTLTAFAQGLPGVLATTAPYILSICLIFFAYTTIIGWDFYSENCLEYLVGRRKPVILTFRWLYILAVFIGPYMTVSAVWSIADIFNGLMAIPNLIAVLALSGVVVKETKDYFDRLKAERASQTSGFLAPDNPKTVVAEGVEERTESVEPATETEAVTLTQTQEGVEGTQENVAE